jgi:hypothetical protein
VGRPPPPRQAAGFRHLDTCGLNQKFSGGLTNVRTVIRVTDTVTGAKKTYNNLLGTPFQPIQDTGAFGGCS